MASAYCWCSSGSGRTSRRNAAKRCTARSSSCQVHGSFCCMQGAKAAPNATPCDALAMYATSVTALTPKPPRCLPHNLHGLQQAAPGGLLPTPNMHSVGLHHNSTCIVVMPPPGQSAARSPSATPRAAPAVCLPGGRPRRRGTGPGRPPCPPPASAPATVQEMVSNAATNGATTPGCCVPSREMSAPDHATMTPSMLLCPAQLAPPKLTEDDIGHGIHVWLAAPSE